jgi:hypothetical protein
MKKIFTYIFILPALFFLMLSASCKKDKNDETGGFDEAAQKSYEAVLSLQNQSLQMFNGYLGTQDTAAAKAALASWFLKDAMVDWATVTSQGVMVKYTNGMCGGLIVDFQRKADEGKSFRQAEPAKQIDKKATFKLTSKKKAIILAAFYDSWPASVDTQKDGWDTQLAKDGFPPTEKLTNNSVTLDKLTTLNKYGIIDFNTHGTIWPKGTETENIVMLTRESVSLSVSKKYWEDLKEGRIVIFQLDTGEEIYGVKPDFITTHNDFKNDTILFYGGFCYSGLGQWPDIINSCAAGTYFGFSWVVRSNKCADWAVDIITKLSDQSLDKPMTPEDWMTSTPIPKHYWDSQYNKDVTIDYNGYGGLTLWKPDNNVTGGIVATAQDGAPILIPGITCAEYVLKCNLTGTLSPTLGYEWDYGDGSSTYYTVNDNLSLYHLWPSDTPYTVKVTVTDYSTNTLVKEFKTIVNFVDPNYLPLLKTWANVDLSFGPNTSIHMNNGSNMSGDYFYFDTSPWHNTPGSTPLTWSDSSFYAQCIGNSGETFTIEGAVSADGSLLKHALFSKTYSIDTVLRYNSSFELTNLPILIKDTLNCWVSFQYHGDGIINQTYITRAELKEFDYISQSYITISNIEWPSTYLSLVFTNDK